MSAEIQPTPKKPRDIESSASPAVSLDATLPAAPSVEISGSRFPNRLAAPQLEMLATTAFIFGDQVGGIHAATAPKLPRNLRGGLAYLSAIDQLMDSARDESRERPNVSLKPEAPSFMGQRNGVTFEIALPADEKVCPFTLARTVFIAAREADLSINPYFETATLEQLSKRPSDSMRSISIDAKKSGQPLFEVSASLGSHGYSPSLRIEVFVPEGAAVVGPIFREIVGRPLDKDDFDPELVKLAEDTAEVLPNAAPLERRIPKLWPANTLGAEKQSPRPRIDPADHQPSPMSPDEWQRAAAAMATLATDRRPHYAADGDLAVGVDGALVTFSPNGDGSKGGTLSQLFSPLASLARRAGLIDPPADMRLVRLFAQAGEVRNQDLPELLRRIEAADSGAQIAPRGVKLGYNELFDINSKPSLIFDRCSNVEIRSADGVQTLIELGPPSRGFGEIYRESFPVGTELAERLGELSKKKEESVRWVERHAYGREHSRLEGHSEKPIYGYEQLGNDLPPALVFTPEPGNLEFARARTILISSSSKVFDPAPVNAETAALRLAHQLSLVLGAMGTEAADKP